MSKKALSPIGGLQPFLFCIGMYFVALFFSIFICSSIFYAINPKKNPSSQEVVAGIKPMKQEKKMLASIN